jgi:hypothetical protein
MHLEQCIKGESNELDENRRSLNEGAIPIFTGEIIFQF